MTKVKTAFFCRNCGAQSPKWMGKCNACGEWNTFVEEVIQRDDASSSAHRFNNAKQSAPVPIGEIKASLSRRIDTHDRELNRVLGGGLVPGSLVLIGGEPGIGKSTLMLQVALRCPETRILYITGEESDQQIRMRAERLGTTNDNCLVLTETNTQSIFHHLEKIKPVIIIADSVQTLQTEVIDSSAGSISQIRECAAELQRYAKQTGTAIFLIGHITKEGGLAGPKILEHMVDTVLQFEGDRNYGYRILRSLKNRFGSTSELGIYEMHDSGLREVSNPSEILLSSRDEPVSGVAIAAMMEGQRSMLVEIQALVSSAVYGTPQRSATGFDVRRLNMLLAVLEKRSGFRLGHKDVFLNIAGGLRVDDPAIDLAVVAAVLSSNQDIPVDAHTCFAAEVGLSGEIRPVSRIEQRIAEAEKLGFRRIFVSRFNTRESLNRQHDIRVIAVSKIEEVYSGLFQ
ncbi:MAG TPA: DNA repair protein RadA [Bacteroidales bacterium]|nr:DNA repair protein RadA [Bacteroidales bacterium]HPS61854.1 DNA repair protein RadA [Bacteroidales bacterium]